MLAQIYVCERGMRLFFFTHKEQQCARRESNMRAAFFFALYHRRQAGARDGHPITMRETLLLALLSTVAALRVGTGGLSRRAAIAGGAAVTLLPPPGFASSGSMAGKTVLIVRWPQVEPPSLHATSD